MNRNPTDNAFAPRRGARFSTAAGEGSPATAPGDCRAVEVAPREIARRSRAPLPGRRPGHSAAPRRCAVRPRRAFAAALLSCAAQACLLQATPASAQDLEPAIAEQAQAAGVNINTASAEELAAGLSGVGASRALAIVRYREQFGDFESIDELTEVSGIGAATVERNRALLKLR